MRVVLRRERRRRNINDIRGCRLPLPHYALIDRVDLLAQPVASRAASLNSTLILVTHDSYLANGIRHSPPPLSYSTIFTRLEDALHAQQKWTSARVIVDLNGGMSSILEIMSTLRSLSHKKPELTFDLLADSRDREILRFIEATCLCRIINRRFTLSMVQQSLAFPRVLFDNPRERFTRSEWEIIRLMAQGVSLRHIAEQQQRPYHRVIYRLTRILSLLQLQKRQQFIRLLQRIDDGKAR